jgi:hypothetical protein
MNPTVLHQTGKQGYHQYMKRIELFLMGRQQKKADE